MNQKFVVIRSYVQYFHENYFIAARVGAYKASMRDRLRDLLHTIGRSFIINSNETV